jgi:hypothetical protein
MELHERIAAINSQQDLADFVDALCSDLAVNRGQWENKTLERYLEAMGAWIRSMDGYYKNTGQPPVEVPSCRTLADILYAAKIYE